MARLFRNVKRNDRLTLDDELEIEVVKGRATIVIKSLRQLVVKHCKAAKSRQTGLSKRRS